MTAARSLQVTRRRALSPEILEVVLESPDGAPLPSFSPGSHVIVHAGPDGEYRNAYSLADDDARSDRYRFAVRHLPNGRGGSHWMHTCLREGDVVEVESPRNLFALSSQARKHILVAGGIGITPFVSYAHRLSRSGTPFELHYAVRDPREIAFVEELRRLCGDALVLHTSNLGFDLVPDLARDVLPFQPLGTHLSVCGPGPMIEHVRAQAAGLGWPPSTVHFERFSAEQGARHPFTAVVGPSRRAVDVSADETLLEALERVGSNVPSLCRQGVCGECRTPVLSGVPDHRDVFLTDAERASNDSVMPCVSRCVTGPLVLDVPFPEESPT